MASGYWKYVFVNVAPEKFNEMSVRVGAPKDSDFSSYTHSFENGVLTVLFGGESLAEVKAWFESNIISDLGLEVSISQSTDEHGT